MSDAPVRRILVAVDFSACSKAAVHYAAGLAAPVGATMDLLHVYMPEHHDELHAWWTTLDDRERAAKSLFSYITAARQGQLNELAVEVRLKGVRDVNVRLLEGVAAKAIVSEAKGYDLVVLGTQGRTRLRDFIIGSVAERVVRHSPVPVLVVPDPETA
jgi:nucleotide-binding universal stress UspA family protein